MLLTPNPNKNNNKEDLAASKREPARRLLALFVYSTDAQFYDSKPLGEPVFSVDRSKPPSTAARLMLPIGQRVLGIAILYTHLSLVECQFEQANGRKRMREGRREKIGWIFNLGRAKMRSLLLPGWLPGERSSFCPGNKRQKNWLTSGRGN